MSDAVQQSEAQITPPPLPDRPPTVTPRAVILGVLLAPGICYWVAYTQIRANSTDLTMMSLMAAAVFPLLTLMALSALLRRFLPRLAFSRAEMLTIYAMLACTVGLAGGGFVPFLACSIPAPSFFATPENHWANWFHFLKPWETVSDPQSVSEFYRGQGQFLTLAHWNVWLAPILFWSAFLLTLLFWGYCLNTLLRRPWMDHERLLFPIAQIPLRITDPQAPLWRDRLFLIGIAVPVLLESLNSLHYTFFPTMPFFHIKPDDTLNLGQYLVNPPWNTLGYCTLAFYPLAIGLTFLLPAEISFSCWLFYFACKVELLLATVYGFHEPGAPPASARMPYLQEQSTGAFLGLALLSLYAARHHLALCFRKAFTGKGLDDREEPMSYRAAVIGLLITGVALVVFGVAVGLAWHVALLFFTLYLLFLVTYTRIRAEAGLPWVFGPMYNPHGVLLDAGGFTHYNTQDLTGLARFEWCDMDLRSHMMPNQMDALKIARESRVSLRGLSLALGLATVTALAGSWLSCLHIFYVYGAASANTNNWYSDMGRMAYTLLQTRVNNPSMPSDMARIWAMTAGAVLTIGLSLLRARFLWWPLNPIGYIVANNFTMDWLWCPTLIAWFCKTVTLRYGGVKGYRTVLPFFLGLVVGDILLSALWALLYLALNISGYRTFPI